MRDMMELNAKVSVMGEDEVMSTFGTEKGDVDLLIRYFAKGQLNGENGIDPLNLYHTVLDAKAEQLKKDYQVKKESVVAFVRTMVKEQFLREEGVELFAKKKGKSGANSEQRTEYSRAYTAWKSALKKLPEDATDEQREEVKEKAFAEYNAKWK